MNPRPPLLDGLVVLDVSIMTPAGIGGLLADLGATVVKVESPSGDQMRTLVHPIVEGTALLFLHANRGKRGVVVDLTRPEGVEVLAELAARADVVIEGMRPGTLARRGLDPDALRAANPAVVLCSLSGYGTDGPYRDLPAHGGAFDAWAGHSVVERGDDGEPHLGRSPLVGINAGPYLAALGILAAVLRARATGEGATIEVAQGDAAAYFDWYQIETWQAYERPEPEVQGMAGGDRRLAPEDSASADSVRYQVYETSDGMVLFQAVETHFWRRFCAGADRADLFERWPGRPGGDMARGDLELQRELRALMRTRTTAAWMDLALAADVPIAPVNTQESLRRDPHFRARFDWLPGERLVADQLPLPVRVDGAPLPEPTRAPALGEHTDAVLVELLGWDAARLAAARAAGALG